MLNELEASIAREIQERAELKALMEQQKPADFEGFTKRVMYIPSHAEYNWRHEDCETGIVSSTNEHYVFVRYWNPKLCAYNSTAVATAATDLRKII